MFCLECCYKSHSKIGICFTSAIDKETCLNAVAYQQSQRVPTSFSLTGFLSQIKLQLVSVFLTNHNTITNIKKTNQKN